MNKTRELRIFENEVKKLQEYFLIKNYPNVISLYENLKFQLSRMEVIYQIIKKKIKSNIEFNPISKLIYMCKFKNNNNFEIT